MATLIPITEQIRVVWNLTNACPYNCYHCAANANTQTEATSNKHRILHALLEANRPLQIDFSGGDPLYLAENRNLIQQAVSLLDKSHIEISTTGHSLSQLDDHTIVSLAGSYSLTYDYPGNFADPFRPESGYNQLNYEQAIRIRALDIPFDIMLPVRDLTPDMQYVLAINLTRLNPRKIGLLQLMPLGRNIDQLYEITNLAANRLIQFLRDNHYRGDIVDNCVLRHTCSAMTGLKIGLDEFGNVYPCIWCADLPADGRDFFSFGNVLTTPFSEILDQLARHASTIDRSRCLVLDYIERSGS